VAEIAETGAIARPAQQVGLWPLIAYFLKLGTIGFGGPVALVGYMHRDLVEGRRWVAEDDYKLALALAQLMPGPLAAQFAIALGYLLRGIRGASVVGLAFVLPSFLMVVALAMLYIAYGGLWWMQALFYGIGAAVIAIIVIAAYKLARATIKRDPLLWGIFAALLVVTVVTQAELAVIFILAGLLVICVRAFPRGLKDRLPFANLSVPLVPLGMATTATGTTLVQILLFFTKAGVFVFGSGLAVVPFLYEGVVQQHHWLTERQFGDAVAVAMITPGPVVITVAFIGYLVAGLGGATLAAVGIFLPVYFLVIIPMPWFRRHRENAQLKAFVAGATAAATGAIAGAVLILGRRAIGDVPTALIALVGFGLLWRFKLPEPLIVLGAGIIGLIVWVAV
jgi:chromate transporter